MKLQRFYLLLTACFLTGSLAGCANQPKGKHSDATIKTFTSKLLAEEQHYDMTDNRIQKRIADKIGAVCTETWLGETENAADVVEKMILSGEYPDFIYSDSNYHQKLLEANAFIPIDTYLDKYENLKNYFTESEWDRLREDDGHIYIVPTFSKAYLYDTNTMHDDEAFWIQARVLKWGGYPKITTLDEYFDLLERYLKANPTGENGLPNIGYEILTDGWLYFCLENPPQFLDGYPNDGCCIVNAQTQEAIDYNTTPTAKRWFKKLNEAYHKGIIDPDCFVMSAEQYFAKIEQGNVLGMVDQRWNYGPHVSGLPDDCQYVPLGIVIDEGIEEHYHTEVALDTSQGIGISVSCNDVEGAMQFLNDMLDPEVLNLRFWGEAEKDYCIGEDGIFYLTDEQRARYKNPEVSGKERCPYSYFPYYKGMSQDSINAYSPTYQPTEFFKAQTPIMQECLSAYGARTFAELFNKSEPNAPWFPMWSYANSFTADTPHGKAKDDMATIKHQQLPLVVMGDNFEASWSAYMKAYEENCDVNAYLLALTEEIQRRAAK